MVIKYITLDIVTNLNITPILLIVFRYHTVDYQLKMSDILKIEYDLTLTLTAPPLLPMPRCYQACRHCPQKGCGHVAALTAGAPAIAAALAPCCSLPTAAVKLPATTELRPPPLRCHAAATPVKLPATAKLLSPLPCCCTASATLKPPTAIMLPIAAKLPSSCRVWCFWWCGCVLCVDVWYQQCFFLVGDGINHPLSQQVKMDKIDKHMILNAHSAEKKQKCSVIFTREKYGPCVYFDMQMLPMCIFWHATTDACGTHIYKICYMCIMYKVQFFVMVKSQMQDDACVYRRRWGIRTTGA